MTPIGLTIAFELLEQAREQLDAQSVTATYETAHGVVAVFCDDDGPRMYVNGERVPIEETG
jgi:hypothetical protein